MGPLGGGGQGGGDSAEILFQSFLQEDLVSSSAMYLVKLSTKFLWYSKPVRLQHSGTLGYFRRHYFVLCFYRDKDCMGEVIVAEI